MIKSITVLLFVMVMARVRTRFKIIIKPNIPPQSYRLATRKDLQKDDSLKKRVLNAMDRRGIVGLGGDEKLEGRGFGGDVRDGAYGCCK